ncbi:MAG: hypothetical protein ACE5FG_01650 [Myxococcota bacterium]
MRSLAIILSAQLLLVTLLPTQGYARERSTAAHMALGIAAAACTIPYGLAKTLYAVGGTLTGGLAWVITGRRSDIARAIIQPAVRGDYVVLPENLTLEKPLIFSGRDPRGYDAPYR